MSFTKPKRHLEPVGESQVTMPVWDQIPRRYRVKRPQIRERPLQGTVEFSRHSYAPVTGRAALGARGGPSAIFGSE